MSAKGFNIGHRAGEEPGKRGGFMFQNPGESILAKNLNVHEFPSSYLGMRNKRTCCSLACSVVSFTQWQNENPKYYLQGQSSFLNHFLQHWRALTIWWVITKCIVQSVAFVIVVRSRFHWVLQLSDPTPEIRKRLALWQKLKMPLLLVGGWIVFCLLPLLGCVSIFILTNSILFFPGSNIFSADCCQSLRASIRKGQKNATVTGCGSIPSNIIII